MGKLIRAVLRGGNTSNGVLLPDNLSYTDLSQARLGGANLSGANLHYTDLSDAYLGGANLSGADLSGAVRREVT